MSSPTDAFFDELANREHVVWLEQEHGRLRFEVVDADCIRQWTVVFDDGDVQVSKGESDVDGVVRADRAVFDRVVSGQANLMAAALRGEVSYTGSIDMLTQMDCLLPGPQGQLGPRKVRTARERAR